MQMAVLLVPHSGLSQAMFGKLTKRDYFFFETVTGATAHVGVKMVPPMTTTASVTPAGTIFIPTTRTTTRTTTLTSGTTSSLSTSLPSTTVITTTSTTVARTTSTSAPTPSMSTYSNTRSTTTTTTDTISASYSVSAPLPEADSTAAMIGGIVGGLAATILVGAAIACLIVRRQRQSIESVHLPNAPPESNYGRISSAEQQPRPDHYGVPCSKRDLTSFYNFFFFFIH
jgi:hypothetical protein